MKRTPHFICMLVWILVLPLLFGGDALAQDEESILNFASRIYINADGSLDVEERITVNAMGAKIVHGIYRDFPTFYTDARGNRREVVFAVTRVLRDGRPENYAVEDIEHGQRIFFGSKEHVLQPGRYVYTFSYHTDWQLGYYKDFDELYWNVTGNDWQFAMENVEAVIILPPGAEPLKHAGYTGVTGAKGQDFQVRTLRAGEIRFVCTHPLAPHEGLTVAVSWPKGHVQALTLLDHAARVFHGQRSTLAALVGMVLIVLYCHWARRRIGPKLPVGPIVTRSAPPEGCSPAMIRYIQLKKFDNTAFAATLVSMAIKGYLHIAREDGTYSIAKTGRHDELLSEEEQDVAVTLFDGSREVVLNRESRSQVARAVKRLRTSINDKHKGAYFSANTRFGSPPCWIFIATVYALVNLARGPLCELGVYSLLGVIGLSGLLSSLFRRKTLPGFWLYPVLLGLLALVGYGMYEVALITTPLVPVFMLIATVVCQRFVFDLERYTPIGRKVMDEIEGFSRYLSSERQDNPPSENPAQLWEKYLPFALALGIAKEWDRQFCAVLSAVQVDGVRSWYHHDGSPAAEPFADFTSNLGSSLALAIESSSGSSGSGSSGGGGGGGGGGGW